MELKNLYQGAASTPTKDDNREFVMETIRKKVRGEISAAKWIRLLKARDIDPTNAIDFFNENRNKTLQLQQQNDVYELLKSFIINNPQYDVFVDECPILWNPKSK